MSICPPCPCGPSLPAPMELVGEKVPFHCLILFHSGLLIGLCGHSPAPGARGGVLTPRSCAVGPLSPGAPSVGQEWWAALDEATPGQGARLQAIVGPPQVRGLISSPQWGHLRSGGSSPALDEDITGQGSRLQVTEGPPQIRGLVSSPRRGHPRSGGSSPALGEDIPGQEARLQPTAGPPQVRGLIPSPW